MCKVHYREVNMPIRTKPIEVKEKEVVEADLVEGEDPGKEDMLAYEVGNHAFIFCLLFHYVDYSTHTASKGYVRLVGCSSKRMSLG